MSSNHDDYIARATARDGRVRAFAIRSTGVVAELAATLYNT